MSDQMKSLMRLYDEDYYIHGKTSSWKQGYNERTMRGIHKTWYDIVKRCFPNAKRKLIMGCALGMQVKICREQGEMAVGIDWNRLLGKHKISKHVVRGSVVNLPFRDNTFDLAVHANLLEHVPAEHIEQLLMEQKRVAKDHFMIIPHGNVKGTANQRVAPKERDITHVTWRPHSYWLEMLKIIGHARYFEKKKRPPWNIYIIRC